MRLAGFDRCKIDQLSGGQKQRVAMARALINDPSVLLLDEPLGALDLQLRLRMQEELRRLHKSLGNTFIFVTHDQGEAMAMSDRIAVMDQGRILQVGTPEEIYESPKTRFVADFVGHTNVFDGRVETVEGNGDCLVACEGVSFRCRTPAAGLGDGDAVSIAVRYENISLGEAPQGAPGTGSAATVTEKIYMGGVGMDARHRHNLTYAHAGSDRDEDARAAYGRQRVRANALTLRDPRLLELRREYEDDRNLAISPVFPNAAFQQLNNSLATRQVQTKGIDAFDLVWTYFGYADDDEDMTAHRLRQSNLFGPGGLVSMEDAEALEIAHRASRREDGTTVIEVGGKGEISDRAYRLNDVPVRGFWSCYAELMDIDPPGAVR